MRITPLRRLLLTVGGHVGSWASLLALLLTMVEMGPKSTALVVLSLALLVTAVTAEIQEWRRQRPLCLRSKRGPGDRYRTTLSTGDRIEGSVVAMIPNRGVQVTVDGWNNALYRVWLDRVAEQSSVNSWLSAYGVPENVVSDFDARMRREIERMAAVAVG